jgi:murein DD-endopeptidase MepM/ murein hydrolase activator NlpD
MQFSPKILFTIILFLQIFIQGVNAQTKTSLIPRKDSLFFQDNLFNSATEDYGFNPADEVYNNIWTSERLNPYKIPIDSLKDSIKIDCSHFHIPVPGIVTSDFGPRRYRFHYGTDLRLNIGDSVVAAFSGKVRIIDYEAKGYGHYVVIRHDNGLETVYGHLSHVLVSINQSVKAGQLIALGGNTGRSTGPHLHFEMRYLGNALNPASVVNFATGQVHNKTYMIIKKKSFNYQREVKMQKAARYYIVRKGDTLSQIAMRNGTNVKSICRMNGLKPKSKIKPGQKIRVR